MYYYEDNEFDLDAYLEWEDIQQKRIEISKAMDNYSTQEEWLAA